MKSLISYEIELNSQLISIISENLIVTNDATNHFYGIFSPQETYSIEKSIINLSFIVANGVNNDDHLDLRCANFQKRSLSFNQPKFCPNATWNKSAITFADENIIGRFPDTLFINTNNTIYSFNEDTKRILIWANQSSNPTSNISGNFVDSFSIFVTNVGDIFIDNGGLHNQVNQWIQQNESLITVMSVDSVCSGLFVDQNNSLYCSMPTQDKVVKRWLNDVDLKPKIVAGNGTQGSALNQLYYPCGIFVDVNFDLYVADHRNDRIQQFEVGQLNGTTKVGNGSSSVTITLNGPSGIVLDAQKYLFIVERGRSRIIGEDANGFRCLVGCDGDGSQSHQLSGPITLSFDIDGNIYVSDWGNDRIQKFNFEKTSCQNSSFIETTTKMQQNEMTTIGNILQSQQTIKEETTIFSTTINQISTKFPKSEKKCSNVEIDLIPHSTFSSPIQIRRNRDFYILSKIRFDCSKSFQIKSQWKIRNCTTKCTNELLFDSIDLTRTDLYIPSKTFPYGIYEFTLHIQLKDYLNIRSSKSIYIQVNPTGITVNLVALGTSMITSGYEQDLHLNPGKYSNDPDGYPFNSTDWTYLYDCRAYNTYDIVDRYSINNPSELSCLSNQFQYEFDGVELSKETSVTIFAGSLELDETYTFSVQLTNRRNRTIHAFGSVLVQIKDSQRPMISIGCVIPTLCPLNLGYRLINPTMQLALFSRCESNCQPIENIKWNLFYKSMNSPSSTSQWSSFEETDLYAKIYIFGANTTNVTIADYLFLTHHHVKYWRFEVTYTFRSQIGSSALDFEIQMEFVDATCSIFPTNGTTMTRFHIACYRPSELNFIREYSLYYWLNDSMKLTIIAFSPVSNFTVQLPSGKLNLVLQIRDLNYRTTKLNLTTIEISSDLSLFYENNQSVLQILHTKDRNFIAQIISSLSQQLNGMTDETLRKSIQNGIQPTRIFVSSLGQQRLVSENFVSSINQSTIKEINEQFQSQAELREYLSEFITDLTLSIESMKLQLSTLIQLTETTNQLTRQTLMIVTQKCYQLSKDLHSLSSKVPYEDIQMTGQQLLQCSANILTGVNGVLQQRTSLLKSDFQSSTKIPDDYDTNLDSDWSNLKLFVDGNDFSMEKINENRNRFYQEKLAKEIIEKVDEIISLVTSSFNIHLNIGQKMIIDTPETFVSFEVLSIESLSNKSIKQVGGAEIHLSSNVTSSLENNSPVFLVRSMMERLAIYDTNTNTNLSTMISLTILDRNGNEIPFETTKQSPIRLVIPRDPNVVIPPMIYHNVSAFNSSYHNQTFHYHFVNISSSLPISIHLEFEPIVVNLSYLLIYKFDQIPRLNRSMNQIDGWKLFCSSIRNSPLFLDNQQTIGHQTFIFGLRELTSSESNEFCLNETLPIPIDPVHFTSDYQTRIYTSGCYYLNKQNQWKSDGLIVGSKTNHYETECFSTHLTKFASGFVILPEMIDWNYAFNNADFHKNKTIYLTVITVTLIYITLMIYARKYDKKDFGKLGVTPLSDNRSSDNYFYQLIVFTGHRKDSGTKSKVHFVLYGENEVTRIRTFDDPQREIFQRGGIDSFIMRVPKSLGLLNCLHIWHDNSGKDSFASWFLKYIIVRDLQTMETSYFISQRWFAVEKDDGKIERVFPIANEDEKKTFSFLLSKKAFHNFSDGHLWFSIFARPQLNQFSRVQRCTCCFVLLFISMLSNIMFYDLANEAKVKNSTSLSFGTFSITSDEILIGIMSELISLIPSILLVQLFRCLRSRHQRMKPIFVVSIFFIIVRGIEFGDMKSQQWLTSVLSSFFSSIFLTEPIKILSLGIIFAFFCRKSTNEDEEMKEYFDENQLMLNKDEENLHSSIEIIPSTRPKRLTSNEIACARQIRLRELQMWKIIREIIFYICFLSLLSVIVYSNHNENASFQVQHLRKSFQMKFSTVNEYWKWLEEDFVGKIRAQKWYNKKNVENLRGYLNDTSNRLLGWALMKQLRIRTELCPKRIQFSSICRNDLSLSNEEKRSFTPGWFEHSILLFSSSISQSFQYKSKDRGYIYEFHGSIKDLRENLSELHRFQWIDQQTREIQIQMSLFNPNVNLFTFVTLQTQFDSTGNIDFQSRFEPIHFYGIRKRPEWEIQEQKDQQMRQKYLHTTDTLRLRTNQLANQINRMYFNQRTTNV
ncbi:unnamed protein product [Adineta ricciae]|uniref:PLAT domain-containing protein n=1 Tax=Adineta ricciae TaxID=249248 RepID=A0A815HLM3_ADIRI|nr:unnamed protein product [Adineta ricciae]